MTIKGSFLTTAACPAVLAILTLAILIHPGSSALMLIPTQKPVILDDMIVIARDADPQGGVVWITVYENNTSSEPVVSDIVSLGENLSFSGVDLRVMKIYAGGERDLVALELHSPAGEMPETSSGDGLKEEPEEIPAKRQGAKKGAAAPASR